ncbi:hypothetical protein AAIG86_30390, partial [Pseudomonas aeruginosa]
MVDGAAGAVGGEGGVGGHGGLGVVDKGEGDKRWAIVGIKATDKDRDGFDVDTTYKLRVFGDAVKNGLHNAYRNLAGVEVYAPYNDEFDEKYKRISYSL